MGWFDTAKEALNLAKKIGSIPLQQSIIDLQQQILDLQQKYKEANAELEKKVEQLQAENNELKSALQMKGKLKKKFGCLWEVDDQSKVVDGPFCISCWERNGITLTLIRTIPHSHVMCPQCKIRKLSTRKPETIENSDE